MRGRTESENSRVVAQNDGQDRMWRERAAAHCEKAVVALWHGTGRYRNAVTGSAPRGLQ
jgi:hypothetical protein